MKKSTVVFIILLILLIDQASKFYIKTNFYLGESVTVFNNWFKIFFIENEGMAWGWKLGESGTNGKLVLTLFRLVAVIFGGFYIRSILKNKLHKGYILCVALIFAGAIGNLIDSLFYGMIFSDSDPYIKNVAQFIPEGGGYGTFLHGKVVDMLYFPIFNGRFPEWLPIWGGETFEFFSPVFNIADASISIGLIIIILMQKRFFSKKEEEITNQETPEVNNLS
ncbi:lipoprotein signal peptidase [Polluticaenibacter yanchengensis]|uniref:Lipoprotein signal peptidase n=1 Tax=Polluticaenibacter yanchengensis TaxID=3014562 RepID=A0ABT4UPK1_9BACT|nr:lipoprotein signal peptidase [Chitinophagaceae bacterium LY-5]